jgi:hypothetical protein
VVDITVEEQSVRSGKNVLSAVTKKLEHDFGIAHTTIQVEVGGCDSNDMFCVMKVAGSGAGKPMIIVRTPQAIWM